MSKRHSFATTIIGKSSLLREGIAKILHSANFRIVASASSADDLPGRVQADAPLFLIVHTGDDFDFAAGQIEFFRDSYPDGRIAIVADRYRPGELVSAFRAGANGCFVQFFPPANTFRLLNDAGTAWLAPLTPGTGASSSNSQCTLNAANALFADDLDVGRLDQRHGEARFHTRVMPRSNDARCQPAGCSTAENDHVRNISHCNA